jgi:hypothetical protein
MGAHAMYEAFDSFLGPETWHTNSGYENERFYRALATVVRADGFNPDAMAEYMREKKDVDRDNEDQTSFNHTIDKRTTEAWAIYEFLRLGLA